MFSVVVKSEQFISILPLKSLNNFVGSVLSVESVETSLRKSLTCAPYCEGTFFKSRKVTKVVEFSSLRVGVGLGLGFSEGEGEGEG